MGASEKAAATYHPSTGGEPVTLHLDLNFYGLTKNEAARVLTYLPALHPSTVTRIPTTLGGKRFTVKVVGVTVAEARDMTHDLHGYLDAVAKGQAR